MEITQGNTTVALVFTMDAAGLVPTVLLSKNGNPFAPPAGAVTEIGNGSYQVAPNATDANTLGTLLLHASAAGHPSVTKEWTVIEAPAPPPAPTPGESIVVTALDRITLALQTIGKHSPGEPVPGELAEQAFSVLSEMMDNWRTQKLMVPQLTSVELPITAGKTSYTIGPGGDLDIPRPFGVRFAFLLDAATPTFRRRLPVLDDEALAHHPYQVMAGGHIPAVYYLPTFPLGTVHVPADAGSGTLVLYLLTGLVQFASLSEPYTLLPGYAAAIRYNLALQLSVLYGVQMSAFAHEEARRTMGDVKRVNQRHRLLTNYFAEASRYNIYTDETS